MVNSVYAVIDTNVIVSALISRLSDASPLKVMGYLYSGYIIPVWNDEILAEYKEVLSREKFHLNSFDIEEALAVFTTLGLRIDKTPIANETFPDPKDIVFYEVKMSKEGAYLVTGNVKHFPKRPFVVTPREMVEILEREIRGLQPE